MDRAATVIPAPESILRTVSLVARQGMVISNQLSAQLLAVEGATQSVSANFIRYGLREVCERTNSLSLALQVALQIQPTFVMRALLHRPDISATYLGNGYVQVSRCLALTSSLVQLLPFNGTCFDALRIALRLPSGSVWHAFLSPSTESCIITRLLSIARTRSRFCFSLPKAILHGLSSYCLAIDRDLPLDIPSRPRTDVLVVRGGVRVIKLLIRERAWKGRDR